MRHWFLIFMIALLPLHGWTSEAMATGMAAGKIQQIYQAKQFQSAINTIATTAHPASDESTFDHHKSALESAQTQADCAGHNSADEAQSGSSGTLHCDSCSACQACHTVALSHTAAALAAVFHPLALPQLAATHFASADTALRHKPPIS